jgi:hypothetical protein
VHDHDDRLLLGRLVFHGEQHATAELQIVMRGRAGGDQLRDAPPDGGSRGQMVEIFAGVGVLGGAPLLDGRIVPVFQPAIIVGNFDALIFVGNRALRRVRRLGDGRALSKASLLTKRLS